MHFSGFPLNEEANRLVNTGSEESEKRANSHDRDKDNNQIHLQTTMTPGRPPAGTRTRSGEHIYPQNEAQQVKSPPVQKSPPLAPSPAENHRVSDKIRKYKEETSITKIYGNIFPCQKTNSYLEELATWQERVLKFPSPEKREVLR